MAAASSGAFAAAAWARGRAAWPDVELDPSRFAAHLDELVTSRAADDGGEELAGLQITDLYLACACAEGLPAALRAFDRSFLDQVPSMVRHLRLSPDRVDEVRQATRQRLLVATPDQMPRIAAYAGRAPLSAWLRATVIRVALTLGRSERRHPASTEDARLFERVETQGLAAGAAEPELQFVKRLDRELVRAAFATALGELTSEQRLMLRMHYVEGAALSEIALVAAVHKSTISRRLAQAEADLATRMRTALGERLSLPEAEVQSLIDLVMSQLDLSLTRLLPPG